MKVLILSFCIVSVFSDLTLKQLKNIEAQLHEKPNERELYTRNEFQTGSAYTQQIQDTNTNLNEMMSHSKRQSQLKDLGQLFEDLSLKLDDYRDGVARKLNELHMTLQRPKIPMNSPAPGIMFNPQVERKLEDIKGMI